MMLMIIYGPSEGGIICWADEENILTSIYPSKFILFNKNNPSGKIFDTQYHQESGIDTFHITENILYEVSSNGKFIETNLNTDEKKYTDIMTGFPIWSDKFVNIESSKNQIINLNTNEKFELESLVKIESAKVLLIKDSVIYYKENTEV